MGENMNDYFVAGGTFTTPEGEEWFDLICPAFGEPPYVLIEAEVIGFFGLVWQDVHVYRVENDYTLSLVVISEEALQWGIQAPERVKPDEELIKKLRAVIKLS
jgi:hypothetical protein